MSSDDAKQRLSEIVALLEERAREAQKIQALDKRIAELAGAIPEERTRKLKNASSPKDFARGCGL